MSNQLTRNDIIEVWKFLKEHNTAVPSETIDFIRDAALEKLNELEKTESVHDRLIRGRRE